MEGALGHLGEDLRHRVVPLLRRQLRLRQDPGAVLGELAAEEEVHKVDLADNVDEVQQLTQEEPEMLA